MNFFFLDYLLFFIYIFISKKIRFSAMQMKKSQKNPKKILKIAKTWSF